MNYNKVSNELTMQENLFGEVSSKLGESAEAGTFTVSAGTIKAYCVSASDHYDISIRGVVKIVLADTNERLVKAKSRFSVSLYEITDSGAVVIQISEKSR